MALDNFQTNPHRELDTLHFKGKWKGSRSPLEVETLAAKRAIQFASELDIISAILKDDSQILIQSLQSGAEYLSPYGLLLDDVGLVFGFFNQFRLSHVKRKEKRK